MRKTLFRNKFALAPAFLCLAFVLTSSSAAFAWGDHRGPPHHRGYHWRGGHWWYGDAMVAGLVIGATITSLPPRYDVVYVGGVPYYYDGVYYYQTAPGGYIVVSNPRAMVPAPVVVSPAPVQVASATPVAQVITPAVSSGNTVTINIPDSKGGYTPVVLTRKDGGYTGPQGEFYKGHPSVEQLKVLYGK